MATRQYYQSHYLCAASTNYTFRDICIVLIRDCLLRLCACTDSRTSRTCSGLQIQGKFIWGLRRVAVSECHRHKATALVALDENGLPFQRLMLVHSLDEVHKIGACTTRTVIGPAMLPQYLRRVVR